ncbi:Uncharacterised protein [Cedecea neteri]|uniref:Uncharacterized protein n=1 Tax=Cedecea neteri TaxID=158822 RepID=A0A291E6H3_9ENTR|nr:hypothetical protein CO704_25995 [Cedecea neteri]SQC92030.1 Uncharacterised protein [Cedecea neteri]
MLMLRQRVEKTIAALIVAYAAWFYMDLNAKNIYEQIYYILRLIAATAGIGVLVWFVDGASPAVTRPKSHESIDKKSNDDLWAQITSDATELLVDEKIHK